MDFQKWRAGHRQKKKIISPEKCLACRTGVWYDDNKAYDISIGLAMLSFTCLFGRAGILGNSGNLCFCSPIDLKKQGIFSEGSCINTEGKGIQASGRQFETNLEGRNEFLENDIFQMDQAGAFRV